MKQPFCMQPWDSSPEIVKELFKVLHFLYTYAVMVDISSFTIDEFAQAFQDKVENQEPTLEFWKRSLNPLTWTEILRQVLVAAGFGSKQGAMRRNSLSKEMSLMVKYGLRPGTLKGELFRVLLEQGIHGLKVFELAKSLQISELNLSSGIEELESLIGSTLSSDITLFEKISLSTYRVRINSSEKEVEESQSDTEDSGAVDDDLGDNDDSGCNSGNSKIKKLTYTNHGKSKDNMVIVYTEIDESHPGELYLLGLMEGEYSDLSIEEKLSAIVALIDLLHAGSSFRMEGQKLRGYQLKNMACPGQPGSMQDILVVQKKIIHGKVELEERVAQYLIDLEPLNHVFYVNLCDIYVKASRFDDVKRIKSLMKETRIKKVVPGCSIIEIDGVLLEFSVRGSPDVVNCNGGTVVGLVSVE